MDDKGEAIAFIIGGMYFWDDKELKKILEVVESKSQNIVINYGIETGCLSDIFASLHEKDKDDLLKTIKEWIEATQDDDEISIDWQ